MEASAMKICNLDYLFELAKGDMEFVREMVNVFMEESDNELSQLAEAIADKDHEQVRQLAHKFRSSIPYVGLDRIIGDAASEIEELARSHAGMDLIREHFSTICDCCRKAVEELKQLNL